MRWGCKSKTFIWEVKKRRAGERMTTGTPGSQLQCTVKAAATVGVWSLIPWVRSESRCKICFWGWARKLGCWYNSSHSNVLSRSRIVFIPWYFQPTTGAGKVCLRESPQAQGCRGRGQLQLGMRQGIGGICHHVTTAGFSPCVSYPNRREGDQQLSHTHYVPKTSHVSNTWSPQKWHGPFSKWMNEMTEE